jgi:tetratricopeptide (TPR) repeat protein
MAELSMNICYKYLSQVTMLNKKKIRPYIQELIVYVLLTVVTLAVFWQVNQYDFVNIDDNIYVTENLHIRSGMTLEGFRWAFSTTYAEFWHPLTWLSLMLDNQFYGHNAGGYHLTNLILHIMSTLLLFSLFKRMTGAIWKSAFLSAFFALHPLRVESVAWIAERKDVLSVFFWMLTLSMYIYYTEKPVIKRYLTVLLCFVCALLSKPIVVTLPAVMILLDYWPLGRFESGKSKLILWQLREKAPFFVLSAVFSIITLYAQYKPTVADFPFKFRIENSLISFIAYLEKTFWPVNLAVFYPYEYSLPLWKVLFCVSILIAITVAGLYYIRKLPFLFVGWFWYVGTMIPLIGLIQSGSQAMADRHTYLPSIGIAIILAWFIPYLLSRAEIRKKILFPISMTVLAILALLTWKQCGYWEKSLDLWNHALQVTESNFLAHNSRGIAYGEIGRYQRAIDDFNKAIDLKSDYFKAYNNRGFAYAKIGQYQRAIEDYSQAIRLKPDYAKAHNNRAIAYLNQNQKSLGCHDAQKACELGDCSTIEEAKEKGYCR